MSYRAETKGGVGSTWRGTIALISQTEKAMNLATQNTKRIISLSLSLAKAHFKLRNEGSYLGMFWYLLNPVALFAVILFVKHAAFGHISIAHYPLYLLVGLIMQNYMNRAVIAASDVIRKNGGFIKSVKIPLESLVISNSIHLFYAHLFEAALIVAAILYFQVPIITFAYYALSIGLFSVFVLGLSFIVATLGVFANDINNIWTVCSQILFFGTPIFYAIEPGTILFTANQFNPLYYFVSLARWPAFEQAGVTAAALTFWCAAFALASAAAGLLVFRLNKKKFAELV